MEKSDHVSEQNRYAARSAPSPHHQGLIDYHSTTWAKRFGGKYPFNRSKDPPAAKRLLAAVDDDLARARRIIDEAFRDDWIVDKGARLALIASNGQLPKLIARTAADADETPTADGEHPILADARARGWGADLDAHADEWAAIVEGVEGGQFDGYCVRHSRAESGVAFRKSVKKELSRAKA